MSDFPRAGSRALRLAGLVLATLLYGVAAAAEAPVTFGIEGVGVRASRAQVTGLLMRAGLSEDQVRADPLLVKLPDTASKQNVGARFTFTDDRLTELLFTFASDDINAVKAQADTWSAALRKSYGRKPVEANTSPEGYQVEGWCLAPGVEVSTIVRGSLAALDYVHDEFGACKDAPPPTEQQMGTFMYRLPSR